MNINTVKDNFLAAYHALKFSMNDEDCIEVVDIERRCLATKYLTAKACESKDTACCLLSRELKDYQMLMENKDGVNNYWKEIQAQTPKINNDPKKWKTGLKDVDVALNFVKTLPHQKDNTIMYKKKNITDRNIQNIINIWSNKETMTRNRKISVKETSTLGPTVNSNDKVKLKDNNIQHEVKRSFVPSHNFMSGNNTGQESHFRNHIPKSHSFIQENKNLSQQTSMKLEPKQHQSKYVKNESLNRSKSNFECSNPIKPQAPKMSSFRTAREELTIQQMQSNKQGQKKTLGGKGSLNTPFVCPFKQAKEKEMNTQNTGESDSMEITDERLKNIEPKMIELIQNEIMDSKTTISWDDIAGLESAKKIIQEVVVYPMLRPDIFTGLRRPPKGILLFGPPGTGKTLIGKCIASQSKSTFFSISASSLTSKWIGEGEKMVRALFAVARVHQPSVIFIDEIDSLLTHRSETEHESSRRLKTEFLVQLDGAATAEEDRILIVGATNRPQELDEAARRRLVKRLYVPLPEFQARKQIINNLLATIPHNLTAEDINKIAEQSKGYSGADMSNLCKEASMGPIRSISFSQLENIRVQDVRQVTVDDFGEALINVRPSVSEASLTAYAEWDTMYGAGTAQSIKG